jgi:2-polyprenyl-3-methyl-5-hydroxy-6-metoxy-1,4-benzoquinol methylase
MTNLNVKHSKNFNLELLFKFNLSNKNSLKLFNNSTRDIADLNVFKCSDSGVIVLEEIMTSEEYYEENILYTNENQEKVETSQGVKSLKLLNDDLRRFDSYKELINDSEVLDFGCGRGGFLKLASEISKKSVGVELNAQNISYINNFGIDCVRDLSELNEQQFDLITLNHVFEHLNDPINILIKLQNYLKEDGIIIIEVPHAKDLLLETFKLESFKKFTLWSEHLILHTRHSLEIFTKNSGLHMKSIKGFQRYPISNHFNWLMNDQPSGHEVYENLNDAVFNSHYEKFLDRIDQTDTLIGYFSKNG